MSGQITTRVRFPRLTGVTGPRLALASSLAIWWSPWAGGLLAAAAVCAWVAGRRRGRGGRDGSGPSDTLPHLRLGDDAASGAPVTMSRDEARRHLWLHGSGRSGRRETLLHAAREAIGAEGGWVHVDAAGDAELVTSICSATDAAGLAGHVRILNWMNPARGSRSSALGWNPFLGVDVEEGTALALAAAAPDGDSAGWAARTAPLARAVLAPLVARRDLHGAQMTAAYMRMHLDLDALARISGAADVPEAARRPTLDYLGSLAGCGGDPAKAASRAARQDHAERRERLAALLDALSDRVGPGHGEGPNTVDVGELLASGGHLLVLLPPAPSHPGEARLLGRLLAAELTAAMRTLPRRDGARPPTLTLDAVTPLLGPDAIAPLLRAARDGGVAVTLSTSTQAACAQLGRGGDPGIAEVGTRMLMAVTDTDEAILASEVALSGLPDAARATAAEVGDPSRFGFGDAAVVDARGVRKLTVGHVRDSGDAREAMARDPEGPGALSVRPPGQRQARRWSGGVKRRPAAH